jgi:hypothetical protein
MDAIASVRWAIVERWVLQLFCAGEGEGCRTAEHEQARRMRDFNDVPNVKRDVPAAAAQFNTKNQLWGKG